MQRSWTEVDFKLLVDIRAVRGITNLIHIAGNEVQIEINIRDGRLRLYYDKDNTRRDEVMIHILGGEMTVL